MELNLNELKFKMNLSLYVIVLPSSHFFLIGAEKVIYFSMFSPIQLSSLLIFLLIDSL